MLSCCNLETKSLFEGSMNLPVSETVDHWVEKRSDHTVAHRDKSVPVWLKAGFGSEVYEGSTAKVDDHHSKMSPTSGEGSLAPPRGRNSQHSSHDKCVREKNQKQGEAQNKQTKEKQGYLAKMCICTGQVQERWNIAEEMLEAVMAWAEGKMEDSGGHASANTETNESAE